jgi:NAD(P)-dependent dehydrogenase (short-subunit alcohol dehydrogenase family)
MTRSKPGARAPAGRRGRPGGDPRAHQADLDQAGRELRARGGDVLALRCDVSRPEDVLCNLAGVIQVRPLEAMTREDFRHAMEVHLLLRNPVHIAVAQQAFFSGTTQSLLGAVARLLPRMGGIGKRSAYGYESASRWSPSLLTRSGDAAARRNNEMRRRPAPSG